MQQTSSWSVPPISKHSFFNIPKWVLVAAIVPRCVFLLFAYLQPAACLPPDGYGYLALAENLESYYSFAHGLPPNLSPETFRLPGYPLFLACFIHFLKSPILWIAFAQSLMGTATVFLMWSWLKTVADERAALAGSLVIALDLVILFHTPMVLAETLMTFVEVIALIQTWRAIRAPDNTSLFACGLLWGITMMVKPVFLLFPWILCWVWVSQKKRILIFLLAAYLLPGLWIVRNGTQAQFWGLSSQSGIALLQYPAAGVQSMLTGRGWETEKAELQARADAAHPSGYSFDWQQSQAYRDVAVPILHQHPVLLARYCLTGVVQILAGTGASLWTFYLPAVQLQAAGGWTLRDLIRQTGLLLRRYPWLLPIQLGYALGLGGLYLLALGGVRRLWLLDRKSEAFVLAGGTLYLLLLASHQGYSRFRIPMMPFMAAAFAINFSKKPDAAIKQ